MAQSRSSPLMVLRFSRWHLSEASPVMKEMNPAHVRDREEPVLLAWGTELSVARPAGLVVGVRHRRAAELLRNRAADCL